MIQIFQSVDALAESATEAVVAAARSAIAERGSFRLGVSGGTTPRRLFELLASPAHRTRVDWVHCQLLFADERAVPPDHSDSNAALVLDTLAGPAGIPRANVHRMEAEAEDLEDAARAYEAVLEMPLDLLLLGVGADGHTASLFPGSALVAEKERRVAVVTDSPKPPPRRMTVTPRVLAEARHVLVMVSGAEKARAVALALEGDVRATEIPAMLVRSREWYLDWPAAAQLSL